MDDLTQRQARVEADKKVVETLVEQGVDLEAEHQVDFYFYGNLDNLDKLKIKLHEQGYKTRHSAVADGIIVSRKLPLDQMKLRVVLDSLEQLAQGYAVEFDGWKVGKK